MITYILTYLHTYVLTYLHTYLHTYILTYLPTYSHTYKLTYLHTYIHTYLHTYILGMFQGTICPSEGGEAKDFVPPPKGAERSECFALSIILLHSGMDIAGICQNSFRSLSESLVIYEKKPRKQNR